MNLINPISRAFRDYIIIFGLYDFLKIIKLACMKTIDVIQLKALLDQNADFQLIDVREPHEYDFANLNGQLIPLAAVPDNVDKIAEDKQVIIHCRSGARSAQAIAWLESHHGFDNLYNLEGGILDWSDKIDPSIPKY
jgi:adenylyltransferase/sulfurtransferase